MGGGGLFVDGAMERRRNFPLYERLHVGIFCRCCGAAPKGCERPTLHPLSGRAPALPLKEGS